MNRLAPCDHASSTSRIHRRVVYGVQHVVGHGVRILFEVAYRLRRRRAVPIGSDAMDMGLNLDKHPFGMMGG